MRIIRRPLRLACLFSASLILTSSALMADSGAWVRVDAAVKDGAVYLHASANGPFEYTTNRPSENLFVVDMTGVSTSEPAVARVLESDLVSSYRVLHMLVAGKTVIRLEVLLRSPLEPRVERPNPDELTLVVDRPGVSQTNEAPALRLAGTNADAQSQASPVIRLAQSADSISENQ